MAIPANGSSAPANIIIIITIIIIIRSIIILIFIIIEIVRIRIMIIIAGADKPHAGIATCPLTWWQKKKAHGREE